MGKTLAEAIKEEGRQEGRKQGRQEGRREGRREGETKSLRRALLRLLGKKFGALPAEIAQAVQECSDLDQLEAWLDRVLEAPSLEDMGIGQAK